MRRALAVLTLVTAIPLFAEPHTERRRLISELLEVMDARHLMERSFDAMFETLRARDHSIAADEVPEDYREQWERERKREEEQLAKFRVRLFSNADPVRYADEVYVPLFEERFTSDELRELIVFLHTKTGQKLAGVIPELVVGAAKGQDMLMKAAEQTAEELRKEELASTPWKATMADMRSIATALEARATDTNEYPNVAFEELEALVSPTYIRDLPKVDGWGTPFVYLGDGAHYRIISAGADRRFDWSSRRLDLTATDSGPAANDDADIIYQDGNFIQFPPGSNQGQ
jgi:hypothetical protein